jgi:hypothetical protein
MLPRVETPRSRQNHRWRLGRVSYKFGSPVVAKY